jgi:hypothetical protein
VEHAGPLLAQSGHSLLHCTCLLLTQKRTLMLVDLNYWRGGRPSKAGTPSAMRWKG